MSKGKPEWEKAADIVRDAGGRIVGRTKFQKLAFLLELCGQGEGFQFEYRHYGPYSEDLAEALKLAVVFDLVLEEERKADWGGTYSIYTARTSPDDSKSGQRKSFATAAVQIGSVELELAATAAYLSAIERLKDPWEQTKRLKPEKATASRLKAAQRAYADLREIEKTLPKI